ncbi:MAG TPA: hypothetical protein VIR33_11795 [Thermopolyspora sp.]
MEPGELTAGEIGVHRQPMDVPLFDPGDSLNRAPQRLRDDLLRDLAAAPPHGSAGTEPSTPEMSTPAIAGRPERAPATPEAEIDGRHGALAVAAGTVLLLILRRVMRQPPRVTFTGDGPVGSADDRFRAPQLPVLRRRRR